MKFKYTGIVILIVFMTFFSAGCGSSGGSSGGGSDSSDSTAEIILSATPENISPGGTSTISAKVTDASGNPVDHEYVTFTLDIGSFSSWTSANTYDYTDDTGIATVTYYAPDITTGTAAIIEANTADSTAEPIQINIVFNEITVTATPENISPGGTSTISARVTDASGNPVYYKLVTFTLDIGSFSSWSSSAIDTDRTDDTGIATVTYYAPDSTGTATVTAEAIGSSSSGNSIIEIYAEDQPPPAFIEIAEGYPDPVSINIKGTGGQSTSQIIFDVKDSQGNPVADGYPINFSIDSGPNGGENIQPLSVVTQNGQAGTILRSGSKSGPVSIKATYYYDTNISTTTSQIAINAGQPVGEEFGIFAQYLNISGIYMANLEDSITINAGDIYGNAIPNNTAISFKTYNTGGFFTPNIATTIDGLASNILHSSGTYPQPLQGFVSVTAEANNGGRTTHVTSIAVTPAPDSNYIYAGTDGGGVYKSTNSGATWANISRSSTIQGQNWVDPYVNDIDIDPDNPNTIYAATGYLGKGNIYRSLDGGMSWNSNDTEEWNGVLSTNAAVLTVLCDDGSNYIWAGTEGLGAIYADDGINFQIAASGLGYGKTVRDIVKASGTNSSNAVLYAATSTGIFKSTDGGANWSDGQIGQFTGDNITTLALHPDSDGITDIIYAGTEDAGVWASVNSGTDWDQYITGLGKGLSATIPIAYLTNKGNGVMSEVEVSVNTLSEDWTVKRENTGFSITGSISGLQTNTADDAEIVYTSDENEVSFTISAGSTPFQIDDTFTFSTTRDPGRKIRDFLVDKTNNRLYAITYFAGPLEPHAVGNVYVIELDPGNNNTPTGTWKEANTGLPEHDPPDDTTLFPQHVMAADDPDDPTALYIGGEGINLFKATSGLTGTEDTPLWQESKSGLTNLIMARMPILFSGLCDMDVIEDSPGNYTVYIQDTNGNPPVVGSTFTVEHTIAAEDDKVVVVRNVTYPDCHTYDGTFRDPADADTDIPYEFTIDVATGDKVEFTFTPTCEDEAPGCSGAVQTETYTIP
jgi:hypothetical protein